MSRSNSGPPDASVPKSTGSGEQITLRIEAVTPFTEIRVLDARFQHVELSANTGAVEVQVSPGLYEVGFRNCDDWASQHVIVKPGSGQLSIKQKTPPLEAKLVPSFSFAVSEVAQPPSTTVVVVLRPREPGAGGLEGISVELVRADGSQSLAPDLTPEASGTWCFPAEAGFWRLRINETAARQPFEMAITSVPGYVAHVIAPLLARDEDLRVDLDKLRFRLLPQEMGDIVTPELIGFEEAALAALGTGRSLFGPEIEQLIDRLADDKASNPMLGILAAHLCERADDGHLTFRERMLGRLEQLTGGPGIHPDVAILRLSFNARHGRLSGLESPVPFPPILAASWRLLLEAARQNPGLIPSGSLCERIADRLWSSSLWTAWTAPPLEAQPQSQPVVRTRSIGDAGNEAPQPQQSAANGGRIAELLAHPQIREWFRGASHYGSSSTEGVAWESDAVTPAEAAVATALFPVAKTEEHQSLLLRWADKLSAKSERMLRSNPSEMAEQLGLPQSTVERALNSLADKLDAQANMFNIKF